MEASTLPREAAPAGDIEVERLDRLEQAREIWDPLAAATGHPFGTWEWIDGWWRNFGAGHELYSFVCRDHDGEPFAILPLYIAKQRPVRIARFLGYGDLHAPLCAPADRPRAAAALERVIGPKSHCRVLVAEKLPGEQSWGRLLDDKPVATHPDPVLKVNGMSWEEYLATRSKNLRKEIRRKERRLAREHDLRFRLCDDPDRLVGDIRTLFRLHHMHWRDESTGIFDGDRGRMQEEVACEMLDRGWLRLWIAEVDGEPAAADYGFNFGGSHWFFQSGRDPRFDGFSVGSVLMAHAMREAIAEGVEEIRFLAGDEEYKSRFTDDDYVAETHVLGSGLPGYAGRLAVSMLQSMPDRMRARVMGAGGIIGATATAMLGEIGAVPSTFSHVEELAATYQAVRPEPA